MYILVYHAVLHIHANMRIHIYMHVNAYNTIIVLCMYVCTYVTMKSTNYITLTNLSIGFSYLVIWGLWSY